MGGLVPTEGPSLSPSARRKSWRRATIARRSLPALLNPYQVLCRSISTTLPQQERLEKLMEAAMRLAIERTQSSLQSTPNASLDDPAVQRAMEQTRKAICRLQAESDFWEALLNKHRSKAEELTRREEQGQESGVALDPSSLARSSQYQLIQSKPDYRGILRRQQPILDTMGMVCPLTVQEEEEEEEAPPPPPR
ncbi:kinetochore-associated protein DSN1 homolog [Diretmus argenteus]